MICPNWQEMTSIYNLYSPNYHDLPNLYLLQVPGTIIDLIINDKLGGHILLTKSYALSPVNFCVRVSIYQLDRLVYIMNSIQN